MKKNIRTQTKKKRALALLEERRLAEARELYAEICKIDPLDAESWFRLGTTDIELSVLAEAEHCFRRVVELRPQLDIGHYNLGRALELQSKNDEAIAVYRRLLEMTPHSEAYYNIGTIYLSQGRFAESLEAFRQAQQIEPDNPRLIAAEAGVYEKQGDLEAAYARIKPLLDAGVESPDIAMVLSPLCQRMDCREQAIALLEKLVARRDVVENYDAIVPLNFELARLLDAAGDYDRAFRHFKQGNDLSRAVFDPDRHAGFVDEIMATFTRDFMRNAPRARLAADHLIFIVGMPRSGTTLIEQILASHPQVYGCGELPDVGRLANSLPVAEGASRPYPRGVILLDEAACTGLAQRYLQRVEDLSGGANRVTDKMPQNFQLLGLIAMLFPGAKVIHSLRDPMDTCLSCYFQNFRFQDTILGFSADLGHLGQYYKQYQRLMAHWRATLDIPLLDVGYEELVAEQEAVTRRMLEFCGLPWDEQCLKFYKSKRATTTASYNQVRQPVYRKSVQRWKHYESYLEPLKKALFG